MRKLKLAYLIGTVVFSISAVAGITYGLTGLNYCQHKFETVPGKPSTCLEEGTETTYRCEFCKKLFAYEEGVGAFEIEKARVTPKSHHTPNLETLQGALKEGVEKATSIADYAVYADCAICNEPHEVDIDHCIPFAPSDYFGGYQQASHFMEENVIGTKYVVKSGTKAGTKITVQSQNDSGINSLANCRVPFTANETRYLVMVMQNHGGQDIRLKYGTEYYSSMCQTETTVPAGGFSTFVVKINYNASIDVCYHQMDILDTVNEDIPLSMCGYYYFDSKLVGVRLGKSPNKLQYAPGEFFDDTGMILYADYGNNVKRTLSKGDYQISVDNRPLTKEDQVITVKYRNAKLDLEIVVDDFERKVTLHRATFADGTSEKMILKGQPLPKDIVYEEGKTFLYWQESDGTKHGRACLVPAKDSVIFTAVYKEDVRGENIAFDKDVYVSSNMAENASFQPKNAVDGSVMEEGPSYSWASEGHASADNEEWITIDLLEKSSFNEIHLYPRGCGDYFPVDYTIEVSEDNETFTEILSIQNDPMSLRFEAKGRYYSFDDLEARYVRVRASKLGTNASSGGYYFQLSEIEIYQVS